MSLEASGDFKAPNKTRYLHGSSFGLNLLPFVLPLKVGGKLEKQFNLKKLISG